MLDEIARSQIVRDLEAAHRTRKSLPLLTKTYPGIEIEDAYRVQEAFVARRVAAGARIRGYKVGLTSKPMQEMAGSDEPDFSAMTDDLFIPEATPVPASRFFDPMMGGSAR